MNHLLRKPVRLVVTDRWEFQDENPQGNPEGTIAAIRGEALLLRLKWAIRFRGDEIKALVATPRVPAQPWVVIDTQSVSVNLTPARAASEDADQLFAAAGKWRAWHLIADMSLPKQRARTLREARGVSSLVLLGTTAVPSGTGWRG